MAMCRKSRLFMEVSFAAGPNNTVTGREDGGSYHTLGSSTDSRLSTDASLWRFALHDDTTARRHDVDDAGLRPGVAKTTKSPKSAKKTSSQSLRQTSARWRRRAKRGGGGRGGGGAGEWT